MPPIDYTAGRIASTDIAALMRRINAVEDFGIFSPTEQPIINYGSYVMTDDDTLYIAGSETNTQNHGYIFDTSDQLPSINNLEAPLIGIMDSYPGSNTRFPHSFSHMAGDLYTEDGSGDKYRYDISSNTWQILPGADADFHPGLGYGAEIQFSMRVSNSLLWSGDAGVLKGFDSVGVLQQTITLNTHDPGGGDRIIDPADMTTFNFTASGNIIIVDNNILKSPSTVVAKYGTDGNINTSAYTVNGYYAETNNPNFPAEFQEINEQLSLLNYSVKTGNGAFTYTSLGVDIGSQGFSSNTNRPQHYAFNNFNFYIGLLGIGGVREMQVFDKDLVDLRDFVRFKNSTQTHDPNDQTEFFRYPDRGAVTNSESTGTPDGGATIPALTAFRTLTNGNRHRPHSQEIIDMRLAIEAVAPFYANTATGNAFVVSGVSSDNIFTVAIDSGQDDWTFADPSVDKRILATDFSDVDLVLIELEASDLV